MVKRLLSSMSVAVAVLWNSAASAHDFFLLPETFTTQQVSTIAIKATVGSSFPKPEIVVPADRAERVAVSGPGNPRIEVGAATPTALTLQVRGAAAGLLAAGVSSKARDVDYEEARIPLILEEYRFLPTASAAVRKLPRPQTWKVSSRRFAKTLVCVRTCGARSAADHSFGAHLEFVGHRSMATHFRLLAEGRPLANYPVDLVGGDGKRQHLSTDASGEIHLPATARGSMMLFAAKLEPPVGSERFTLDLTSLTFSAD